MKVVVVGGHARDIGKTSLMVALLGEFRACQWTAVKITQYGHGVCSLDGDPCECAPEEHPFALTEEANPRGRGDTCRYLAAGAHRSLWLRVRQGQLALAFPQLLETLARDPYVMIESNSLLGFLDPDLYLVVLDSTVKDFKESTARYLERADALVVARPQLDASIWKQVPRRRFEGKPLFRVRGMNFKNEELFSLVRRKLNIPAGSLAEVPSRT